MIKIGFIDYFLDNFHGNMYPDWIKNYSNGECCVTCAYAKIDHPDGGMTNDEWSLKHDIALEKSIEDVIAKSDCIMVLSPSHPEMHEELSELALKTGKRVYIDKAFAPDAQAAERMFALAERYKTPCCSSSALAFVSEYEKIDKSRIQVLSSKGAGTFEVYTIHQFEPIIALMQSKPVRIMSVGKEPFPSFIIEFENGKMARTEQFNASEFDMLVGYNDGKSDSIQVRGDIFKNFILKVIDFFKNGSLVASKEQTLSVIRALDAAKKARQTPFTWVNLD